MVLELKIRGKKSYLLDTEKKKISNKMIYKLIELYCKDNLLDIKSFTSDIIENTIRGAKREYVIKYDTIKHTSTGNSELDYITLKNKYGSTILYNKDYRLIYD